MSDVLLPGHVLHLLQLFPVVLDLKPRQTVETTRTSISTHCEDTIFHQIIVAYSVYYREIYVRGFAPVLERGQVIRPRGLLLHVIPA